MPKDLEHERINDDFSNELEVELKHPSESENRKNKLKK